MSEACRMAELAARLKALADASTADLIGVAPGDAFSAEETGELGAHFGPIRAVIVLVQHIIDPVQTVRFFTGEVQRGSRVSASFGDALLRDAAWRAIELLREAGAVAVMPRNLNYGDDQPQHRISYKKAGVLAGLGAFGKNQLLIHPEWGPWMYLRAVVTDAALPADQPLAFAPCDGCARPCFDACPEGALSEAGFDRERCDISVGYRGTGEVRVRLSPHGEINCEECRRGCAIGTPPPRVRIDREAT